MYRWLIVYADCPSNQTVCVFLIVVKCHRKILVRSKHAQFRSVYKVRFFHNIIYFWFLTWIAFDIWLGFLYYTHLAHCLCLPANKYIESRCEDVIRAMRMCCEHAGENSICCSGFAREQRSTEPKILGASWPDCGHWTTVLFVNCT